MLRFLPAPAFLLIAACASTPQKPAEPSRPVAEKPEKGELIGLDANELVSRFGTPRLQVREGTGTKLQFATTACVLDAYLYPGTSGGSVPRVNHVDARNRDGRDVDQQSCIAALLAR